MNIQNELREVAALISQLQRTEITSQQFRSQSTHYGIYTQRQSNLFFIRLRIPNGIFTPAQINTVAEELNQCGKSECHFTTRQGIEIHNLLLEQIEPLLQGLSKAGLSPHETGGNSVRGIMVCPHAGMWPDEEFDVTYYADWLTAYLVRHPDFQDLPRKMKIGISCCQDDCARTVVQDLGFQSRKSEQGKIGFRVMAGGGTGAVPRLAQELLPFLPAEEILRFTEAFLRVFNRHGDRQNRRRARVKFLVQSMGLEPLRELVLNEWQALKQEQKIWPKMGETVERIGSIPQSTPDFSVSDAHFAAWLADHVEGNPNSEFRLVRAGLSGGMITTKQLRKLVSLTAKFDLSVRITSEQDLVLRPVRLLQLVHVYNGLMEVELPKTSKLRLVACPGSSACSNAFTNSRALGEILLTHSMSDQCRIHVSGCSNGCTLHMFADVGLEGIAQRLGEKWLPAYKIWIGGRLHETEPRLATHIGIIAATKVPAFLDELGSRYICERKNMESVSEFLERLGPESFRPLAAQFRPGSESEPVFDWGDDVPYRSREASAAGIC